MKPDKKTYTQEDVDFVLMARDIKETKEEVSKIKESLEKNYVTDEQLKSVLKDIMPYINVVKGFIVMIIMAVGSYLVYLSVRK